MRAQIRNFSPPEGTAIAGSAFTHHQDTSNLQALRVHPRSTSFRPISR